MKGNPITQKTEFMPFILAHLTQVVYLDYKRVDQNVVRDAYYKLKIAGLKCKKKIKN